MAPNQDERNKIVELILEDFPRLLESFNHVPTNSKKLTDEEAARSFNKLIIAVKAAKIE